MIAVFDSIPTTAIPQVELYLSSWEVDVKVVSKRKTKHGDYRKTLSGAHQITINKGFNPYRFLITLIHEITHLYIYKLFKNTVKPHGLEWKNQFRILILPVLNPDIFPKVLLPLLATYFKNPKASTDSDIELVKKLKMFDPPTNKNYINIDLLINKYL